MTQKWLTGAATNRVASDRVLESDSQVLHLAGVLLVKPVVVLVWKPVPPVSHIAYGREETKQDFTHGEVSSFYKKYVKLLRVYVLISIWKSL